MTPIFDGLVIGSGIAGLSPARRVQQLGANVQVLEGVGRTRREQPAIARDPRRGRPSAYGAVLKS